MSIISSSKQPTTMIQNRIARPVQWVAACGGSGAEPAPAKAGIGATTRAVMSAAIGAMPGLRVLSRRPSIPLSAKWCCKRLADGNILVTIRREEGMPDERSVRRWASRSSGR